jgi:predicted metal-binding protein
MVDGKYVSANDPRAINSYHVGAWAQNVSKSGDQVVMDVYINKAVAETKPDGKRLINRLDEMIAGTNTDPIHLSTGLLTNKEKVRRVEAEEVLMDRSQHAVRPYRYPAR